MNAASIDIKTILESESELGLAFGQNLFIGLEPPSPKDCTTIFDAPGAPPAVTLDLQSYYYSAVQIRVRSGDYGTGIARAYLIMSKLHGRGQEVIGGTLYMSILASGDPFLLDYDDNHNARIILNLNLQRR